MTYCANFGFLLARVGIRSNDSILQLFLSIKKSWRVDPTMTMTSLTNDNIDDDDVDDNHHSTAVVAPTLNKGEDGLIYDCSICRGTENMPLPVRFGQQCSIYLDHGLRNMSTLDPKRS